MALVIGVMGGVQINIGDSVLKVKGITEDRQGITVAVDGKTYELTTESRTQISKDVWLCVGKENKFVVPKQGMEVLARLAIEAPRSIAISRVKREHASTN